MILAAVSFSDPLMLAGVAAALVPVLLHLLHRVRAPVVAFPTLRFLRITAQKTARRRHIQQYFLLLVRVVVFALVAMAVASPLIRGGSAGLAYGFVAMLLGGAALLVLAGVWSAAALDRSRGTGSAKPPSQATDAPARPSRAAGYWTLSACALIAALMLAGVSAYGLASDRFFSTEHGQFTGESTAMAIIFDNSQSMLVREPAADNAPEAATGPSSRAGVTRLSRARDLVRQLLGESLRPAEAAIFPTNPGEASASMPLTHDMTRLLGYLGSLNATGRALPMQERIRAAVSALQSSKEPGKMLVIVSDFVQPAFADAGVFAGIKENAPPHLQLVFMPVSGPGDLPAGIAGESGGAVADVGITSFGTAEGGEHAAVGMQKTFQAELVNNGDLPVVRDFAFTIDGKALPGMTSRVQLGVGGVGVGGEAGGAGTGGGRRTLLKVPYRLADPGPHTYGLALENGSDAMEWDDRREMVLNVADRIAVLVIGAENADAGGRPRARSSAFYFMAALAPFGQAAAGGGAGAGGTPWPIAPVYRGIDQLGAGLAEPADYSAVFVCDVPHIPAPFAESLAHYVHGGGRLMWVLGPSIDAAAYNQLFAPLTAAGGRGVTGTGGLTRGLLPGTLDKPVVTAAAKAVDWVDTRSGPLANLFDNPDPFRSILVTGRWTLGGEGPQPGQGGGAGSGSILGRPLARLGDDSPLLIEHSPAGSSASIPGKVDTLLTTPAAAWSNLGASVVLVPLASRIALGDAQSGPGQEGAGDGASYETGDPVLLPVVAARSGTPAGSVDVTTPAGHVINIRGLPASGATGASPALRWPFGQTLEAGLYHWRTTDGRQAGLFAVNPPGDEADLQRADIAALARESAAANTETETLVVSTPAELLARLQRQSEGTSLTPGFLAMVLMLAVLEAFIANRYRPPAATSSPLPA